MHRPLAVVILIVAFLLQPLTFVLADDVQTLRNTHVELSFSERTGSLVGIRNLTDGQSMLLPDSKRQPLWKIATSQGDIISCREDAKVSFHWRSADELEIHWSFPDGLQVSAAVTLEPERPFAYWHLTLSGIKAGTAVEVDYPIINGIRPLGDERLAVSTWLGSLISNPRGGVSEAVPQVSYGWDSPGALSMQMMALYDAASGRGIYFASNDTTSCVKRYGFMADKLSSQWQITHVLPLHSGSDTYTVPYEAITGLFSGDWLTAAGIYRDWAIGQRWCRESRLANGEIPEWLKQTAIWIWNRGRSENVLTEATSLKRRLRMPVSVFWHWWHGCSYDEGFPEYLPPREGCTSFRSAVARARRKGINSIVYMNSYQWGNSTRSWAYEGAERFAARRIDGGLHSHAFNVFTGRELTPMCMATPFWRHKYATLADSMINSYGVSGIYMDQACLNLRCYDASHGHTLGGGNYWVDGFGNLTKDIRGRVSAAHKGSILAGEGSGEDWISYLDLFLTLEASRERYMGISQTETIPLYQAVYHDRAITFGSYSSLVYPPYDDLWPDAYRPANREKPLPDDFNMQFRMEQAKAFVWGMQPTLANYHDSLWDQKPQEMDFLRRIVNVRRRAMKYLLYGVYTRVPDMAVPTEEIDISRISIYAGRKGSTVSRDRKRVSSVYSGAWKSEGGMLAFALANIRNEEHFLQFSFDASDYDLPEHGRIYLISETDRKLLGKYTGGKVEVSLRMLPRDARVVEVAP